MKTIWKFELPRPVSQVEMPVGAKVIRVARQGHAVCIWAVVESDNALEKRLFATIGTGRAIPDHGRYLGTVDDGPLVWHVFEPENG